MPIQDISVNIYCILRNGMSMRASRNAATENRMNNSKKNAKRWNRQQLLLLCSSSTSIRCDMWTGKGSREQQPRTTEHQRNRALIKCEREPSIEWNFSKWERKKRTTTKKRDENETGQKMRKILKVFTKQSIRTNKVRFVFSLFYVWASIIIIVVVG